MRLHLLTFLAAPKSPFPFGAAAPASQAVDASNSKEILALKHPRREDDLPFTLREGPLNFKNTEAPRQVQAADRKLQATVDGFTHVGTGQCTANGNYFDFIDIDGIADTTVCSQHCYGIGSVIDLVGFAHGAVSAAFPSGACVCYYDDEKIPDLPPEVTGEIDRYSYGRSGEGGGLGSSAIEGDGYLDPPVECYSHDFFQVDYTLDYVSIASDFTPNGPDLTVTYLMARSRPYDVGFFFEDCTTPADIQFPAPTEGGYDNTALTANRTIQFDLPSGIDGSGMWDSNQQEFKFCMIVKNEVEISKLFVTIDTDMDAEFTEASAFDLGTITTDQGTQTADYSDQLNACVCNSNWACSSGTSVTPDQELLVCLKPIANSAVGVNYLKILKFTQDATATTFINNGLVEDFAAGFTSIEYADDSGTNIIVVKTRVTASMFDYAGDPVIISGIVVMKYARRRGLANNARVEPKNRELQLDTAPLPDTGGDGTAGFEFSIALEGDSLLKDSSSAEVPLAKNVFTAILGLASSLAFAML